jgi:hypothetical protein
MPKHGAQTHLGVHRNLLCRGRRVAGAHQVNKSGDDFCACFYAAVKAAVGCGRPDREGGCRRRGGFLGCGHGGIVVDSAFTSKMGDAALIKKQKY